MKWVYSVLVLFGLVFAAAFAYLYTAFPKAAPPRAGGVPMTAERVERGRYLFQNVADCEGCHSDRDWTKYTAPVAEGRTGVGFVFPASLGFPGTIVAPNITPDPETGLGRWTDGEKLRAIREGIGRNGQALFAFMPYQHFAAMSDEDAESLVAYLNTLRPVRNALPRTTLDFPVSVLNRLDPRPLRGPVRAPAPAVNAEYGGYLVRIASCIGCHSQLDKGDPKPGLEYAGGHAFPIGKFLVNSANLTPDDETGLGKWSEERFVTRFRASSELTWANAPPANQGNFTVMPWSTFSHLKDGDLKAIYAYLRTLRPVRNAVETHPALPGS